MKNQDKAMSGKTLYDKIFDAHVVREEDGTALLYIDRHLVHEVTSPQAFEGLRMVGRELWRKESIVAVPDHNVPTTKEHRGNGTADMDDMVAKNQIDTLNKNVAEFKLNAFDIDEYRAAKKAELSAACNTEILSGFYSDVKGELQLYDFKLENQYNLSEIKQRMIDKSRNITLFIVDLLLFQDQSQNRIATDRIENTPWARLCEPNSQ